MMTETAALAAVNAAMLLSSHALTTMQNLCIMHYISTNKSDSGWGVDHARVARCDACLLLAGVVLLELLSWDLGAVAAPIHSAFADFRAAKFTFP
jgi:hypothetical protein